MCRVRVFYKRFFEGFRFGILLLQYKIINNSVVAKPIALGVPYYIVSKCCQIKEELTELNLTFIGPCIILIVE